MAARQIVFDTETTGFDPQDGHRLVEIACVALHNLVPNGEELHLYFNPQRDMPPEAFAVHGLSAEFLAAHPCFPDQVDRLLAFIEGATLIAHNADFDMRFLQAELKLCNRTPLVCEVIDTLQLARRKYPGSPASLDALCRRFGIDLSERVSHGALIDTKLLAAVYLELMGGKEPGLSLGTHQEAAIGVEITRVFRLPRAHAPSIEELAAHAELMLLLKEPLWLQGSD